MAVIKGAFRNDFIHRAGDGLLLPPGLFEVLGVTAQADEIYGGGGDDRLFGGMGDDTLFGGLGADLLNGGIGNDAMTGGAGNDIYGVNAAGDTTLELPGGGIDTVQASLSWTLSAGVEHLILTGTGAGTLDGTGNGLANTISGTAAANRLSGLAGNDTLFGGEGADRLYGGAGDDTLFGGAGADLLDGGAGRDTASYSDAPGAVVIRLAGISSGSTAQGDSYLSVENAIGGAGDDRLTGTTGINILTGGAGNDRLDGLTGADRMIGGTGDDTYVVNVAGDATIELSGGGIDTVLSRINWRLAAEVERLTLTGAAAINGTGNALDNILIGNAAANTLTGGAGCDALFGGAGNDRLLIVQPADCTAGEVYDGGTDDDTLDGGALTTAVDLSQSTLFRLETLIGFAGGLTLTAGQLDQFSGDVTTGTITLTGPGAVDLSDARVFTDVITLSDMGNSLTLGTAWGAEGGYFDGTVNGGAAGDSVTLSGAAYGATLNGNGGDDSLTGGGGADTLDGGANNDTLTGGDGSDALFGGTGDDLLTGGYGDDTMTGGAGVDVITGNYGYDILVISAASDIAAADIYDGGYNDDTLDGSAITTAVDLSTSTLIRLEFILGFSGGLTLTAGQLDQFSGDVTTGTITLTGPGAVDLSDARVFTDVITLSDMGNSLTLGTGYAAEGGYFDGTVNGGAAGDSITLTGAYGATLNGNGGDDTLTSGGGAATLSGGTGSDTFRFTAQSIGVNAQITDFTLTDGDADLIAISGGMSAVIYIGAAAFTATGTTEARFDGAGGLLVDYDGNGASDFRIGLSGLLTASDLAQSDFL